ncbi:MAG TPA: MaoC family dehydratase [Xanthobacteraceae bacterium]|jgi:acyl dehydratase
MDARRNEPVSLDALQARIGQEVGISGWHEVTQQMIDRFADVTGDHQFIHVDPIRAKAETPYGGTIAHGFLTLSLLPMFRHDALPPLADQAIGINYGLERVRFLAPVKSGARVRGRFTLKDITMRSEKEALFRYEVTIEIERSGKPALVAETLSLVIFK